MSWYYTYSLGVQDAEGKIYPILFTPQNERLDIVKNSRSFEPEELDSVFYPLHEENVTNALKEAYSCHEDGEDFDIAVILMGSMKGFLRRYMRQSRMQS